MWTNFFNILVEKLKTENIRIINTDSNLQIICHLEDDLDRTTTVAHITVDSIEEFADCVQINLIKMNKDCTKQLHIIKNNAERVFLFNFDNEIALKENLDKLVNWVKTKKRIYDSQRF